MEMVAKRVIIIGSRYDIRLVTDKLFELRVSLGISFNSFMSPKLFFDVFSLICLSVQLRERRKFLERIWLMTLRLRPFVLHRMNRAENLTISFRKQGLKQAQNPKKIPNCSNSRPLLRLSFRFDLPGLYFLLCIFVEFLLSHVYYQGILLYFDFSFDLFLITKLLCCQVLCM